MAAVANIPSAIWCDDTFIVGSQPHMMLQGELKLSKKSLISTSNSVPSNCTSAIFRFTSHPLSEVRRPAEGLLMHLGCASQLSVWYINHHSKKYWGWNHNSSFTSEIQELLFWLQLARLPWSFRGTAPRAISWMAAWFGLTWSKLNVEG